MNAASKERFKVPKNQLKEKLSDMYSLVQKSDANKIYVTKSSSKKLNLILHLCKQSIMTKKIYALATETVDIVCINNQDRTFLY